MASTAFSDAQNHHPPHCQYSRKQKSLGLLCTNFLKLYNRDGVHSIGLDIAAAQLGVERRRIYDIVNILESVGVLTKKAKNQYYWKGFSAIPKALYELQSSNGKEYEWLSNKTDMQSQSSKDNRKEKSLGLLAKNFVKLFLHSDADMISLDSAATALLGDLHDPTAVRTKVRRLYDIANVFVSMNLLEKTRDPESGRPAFRWLGMKGNTKNALETAVNSISKRRAFGAEITNTGPKRLKADFLSDWRSTEKVNVPMRTKQDNVKIEYDENSMEMQRGQNPRDFDFGPFTPANFPSSRVSENRKARRFQDLEHLASTYRPQYRNQALSDLSAHYASAWKLWFAEAVEKQET